MSLCFYVTLNYMKYFTSALLIILIIVGYRFMLPKTSKTPSATYTPATTNESAQKSDLEVVATNLNIPWELVFLPSGDMLITERPGKLIKIGKDTKVVSEISGVKHIGEGGLLGMALHPKFAQNNYIYLYSTAQESGSIINRVERYKLVADSLSDRTVILTGIKGSANHDGGRIAFGPDGYLYVTTGDAENKNSAQDKNSLNGKILRIKDDGGAPTDNPFGNEVYSFGHRNPQGLAWDENGNLWATEHGPSGLLTGNDEVNLITKGGNYGWPDIKGTQSKEGMTTPIVESGKGNTWAPSGLLFFKGSLYFAGLRGESIYKSEISKDNKLGLIKYFSDEFGRLRTIVLGPDDYFYVLTSNRDGRGSVRDGDDKIIRIKPF